MLTITYTYPGDEPTDARLMFGREFREANPNRNRQIVIGGGGLPATVISVDEVVCDTCNDLVTDTDPCAVTEHGLYCWNCTKEWILPHVKPTN